MGPRRYRASWLGSLTVLNAGVCALLLALLYGVLSAFAAFAARIESWPFVVGAALLILGTALSVTSYVVLRGVPRRLQRWLCLGVNSGALLIYLTLIAGATAVWLQTARRLFLVPAGFQGELYLVHESRAFERNPLWRTKYLFPRDGVLRTTRKMPSLFSDEYRHVFPDGRAQIVKDAGPGTLPDTPENRFNTSEVVAYFGRTSQPNGPDGCYIEEMSIGTRAFLLATRSTGPNPVVKECR